MRYPTLPGSWDDLVVLGAATMEHGHSSADQQVARRLAAEGIPVLYVNPALRRGEVRDRPHLRETYRSPGLHLRSAGLAVLNISLPGGTSNAASRTMAAGYEMHAIWRALDALGGSVRACVSACRRPMLLGKLGERANIFWARDDYEAHARLTGRDAHRMSELARAHARAADLVVAVTPEIADFWASRGHRTTIIPAGTSVGSLAAATQITPAPEVYLPQPIIGYVGTLGERVDADLLLRVARTGESLLLVGHRNRHFDAHTFSVLQSMPNVQWVGHQPPDTLASFMAHMRVGILPYTDNSFNRASFPLQLLDYLAAGLAAVSTPLPAATWVATSHITCAAGADFVSAAVAAANADPTDADVRRRLEVAARHDWSVRVANLVALLPERI